MSDNTKPWPVQWREAVLRSHLTTSEKLALVALQLWANAGRECFPSANSVAELCGLSVGPVRRSWRRAEKAGLLKRVRRRREEIDGFRGTAEQGKASTSNMFRLTLPSTPLDASVYPPCSVASTPPAQERLPPLDASVYPEVTHEKNPKEEPKRAAAARASAIQPEKQDMNSDDMRQALRRPLAKPQVQPEHTVTPPGPRLEQVDPMDVVQAWGQYLGSTRRWRHGIWDHWLAQWVHHATAEQVQEWLTIAAAQPNEPNMRWHTSVITRILADSAPPPPAPAHHAEEAAAEMDDFEARQSAEKARNAELDAAFDALSQEDKDAIDATLPPNVRRHLVGMSPAARVRQWTKHRRKAMGGA